MKGITNVQYMNQVFTKYYTKQRISCLKSHWRSSKVTHTVNDWGYTPLFFFVTQRHQHYADGHAFYREENAFTRMLRKQIDHEAISSQSDWYRRMMHVPENGCYCYILRPWLVQFRIDHFLSIYHEACVKNIKIVSMILIPVSQTAEISYHP